MLLLLLLLLLLWHSSRYWSTSDGIGGIYLGWHTLLCMAQSMVPGQQQAAWTDLHQLPLNASDGYAFMGPIGQLTRTQALWWVATRP
jgi:hypothetical protein